jgi:hypothetical protein
MLNRAGLEQVLVKHWTQVLDGRSLLALVLKAASDSTFLIDHSAGFQEQKSARVSVSRFEPLTDGRFLVWAEFAAPRADGTVVGTAELLVGPDDGAEVRRVIGRRIAGPGPSLAPRS